MMDRLCQCARTGFLVVICAANNGIHAASITTKLDVAFKYESPELLAETLRNGEKVNIVSELNTLATRWHNATTQANRWYVSSALGVVAGTGIFLHGMHNLLTNTHRFEEFVCQHIIAPAQLETSFQNLVKFKKVASKSTVLAVLNTQGIITGKLVLGASLIAATTALIYRAHTRYQQQQARIITMTNTLLDLPEAAHIDYSKLSSAVHQLICCARAHKTH